jgi:UDP-glucose 4-epimerase
MNCEPTTRKADIPIYLTDTRKAKSELSWEPSATPQSIVEETTRWVVDHQKELETTLGL